MDAEEMKKYEEAVRDVIGMHAIVLGRGGAGYVEFDAWLAAHDAEVRAQVVAEEPEWEYGISSGHGSENYVGTRESVDARVRSFEKAGAPLRDGEQIVRRRKVGLWVPVKQEGAETDV